MGRRLKMMGAALVFSCAATASASAQSGDEDLRDELIEWVFEPCMEVAAALDVGSMEQESIDLGIERKHISQMMLASRDSAIREVVGKMKSDATWEDRRGAYPIMLRLCLAQFGAE